LSRKFGGQLPLAIGSYNAGPLAMESWVDRFGDERLDVFVESIPWVQARDYIKRVVGFLVSYEVASGDLGRLQSPTLGGVLPERVERGWGDNVRF
jgi:soluble lytic murein transglycosylase-like protein